MIEINKFLREEDLERGFYLVKEDNSSCFGQFSLSGENYLLAWNGKVEPTIFQIPKYNLYLIGTNETVVGISEEGVLKFCLGLFTPFQFFLETDFGFGIICETGVVLVNEETFSVRRIVNIPDIIVDCKIQGDKIEIETLGENYSF